jgi:hypothetical protein
MNLHAVKRPNIPSVKRLCHAFGECGYEIRMNLESQRRNYPRRPISLIISDVILDGYGVEWIYCKGHTIEYVNFGDPYATTLMIVDGKIRIGDWGTVVERWSY